MQLFIFIFASKPSSLFLQSHLEFQKTNLRKRISILEI